MYTFFGVDNRLLALPIFQDQNLQFSNYERLKYIHIYLLPGKGGRNHNHDSPHCSHLNFGAMHILLK